MSKWRIMYKSPTGNLRVPNNSDIAKHRWTDETLAQIYCSGINEYRNSVCVNGMVSGQYVVEQV